MLPLVCHVHVSVLFNVYVSYSYCYVNTYDMVLFYCWLSFANISCLLKLAENSKKETSSINPISLSYFIFWYGLINLVPVFLLHPYMCYILYHWIYVTCFFFVIKLEFIMWLGIIILRSLKGGPVEVLARSSISPGFQTKVNFKVTASR